jgi:hypothetical protein
MRVFIGWDPNEQQAFDVAERSLLRRASSPVDVQPIRLARCRRAGLVTRPLERRMAGPKEILWDVVSGAPCATEFATSRFLVPVMQHKGWALFTDCDVVFLRDVMELEQYMDPRFAVCVVKHNHDPIETKKMQGVPQTKYARKNWSSVVLWNCSHPAHEALTLDMLNAVPGRMLHQFCWLDDDLIGELPREWNWLVNVNPTPDDPAIAHFTLGGPWFKNWETAPHDELWLKEANER